MADWGKITRRGNVVDRRGIRTGFGTKSIAGVALLMGIVYLIGGNPLDVLNQVDMEDLQSETVVTDEYDGLDAYEEFTSSVLGSNNAVWSSLFKSSGASYQEPTLVLFRERTTSACGGALSMVGPHYCPTDSTIYLDETFFEELTNRFGAEGGDVAEAYVIAHEVGHHVQNQLNQLEARQTNEQSIATELQADCYAGVWAYYVEQQAVFAKNEITEAIDAAAAVGDDRIQQKTQGTIQPESWTHGSSEERVAAFQTGYQNGDPSLCAF